MASFSPRGRGSVALSGKAVIIIGNRGRLPQSLLVSYLFDTISIMSETTYSIGEGPATRVSLSLPEGTAEAIRARVGKREFSAFITAAVERELRGQVLDDYLADYESRKGPVSEQARLRARPR
jgi:hypothetical protein